ncbi:hypothetical protein DSO57_1036393 [Entomophthora muscae]|uniref:Uncharacterized protein n=1 Tax=Entomophthora muscae TaxID=34485 RepID=A0ACC2T061_9FUNG|nr:hypothetical protein DSO57_1036393 [Entomophthora muscae]
MPSSFSMCVPNSSLIGAAVAFSQRNALVMDSTFFSKAAEKGPVLLLQDPIFCTSTYLFCQLGLIAALVPFHLAQCHKI